MKKYLKFFLVIIIMSLMNCGLIFDLHYYAKNGNIVKVKELINNGINVDVRDSRGRTPLLLTDNVDVAKFLIEKGADVNAKIIRYGYAPLHIVKNPEVATVLIENGANVNAEDIWGETPLHLAKNVDIACILIKNGAKINARAFDNRTPLHTIPDDSIKLLIENGADVNAKDDDGDTPLHWASMNNNIKKAILLVENGAKVNEKNKKNETSLIIAKGKGYKDLVEFLEKHGAKE